VSYERQSNIQPFADNTEPKHHERTDEVDDKHQPNITKLHIQTLS